MPVYSGSWDHGTLLSFWRLLGVRGIYVWTGWLICWSAGHFLFISGSSATIITWPCVDSHSYSTFYPAPSHVNLKSEECVGVLEPGVAL